MTFEVSLTPLPLTQMNEFLREFTEEEKALKDVQKREII
jgi:hypothetical protein